MIVPQITYTDADGAATLTFTYPPNGKPAYAGVGQRTDTLSTAGVRQTILLRTDKTWPINVQAILDDGTDLPAWRRFVAWANGGGTFLYFPDADNSQISFQCFQQEKDVKLAYSSPGVYSYAATFQQEVNMTASNTSTGGSLSDQQSALLASALQPTQIGIANGIAPLDSTSKVPAANLPTSLLGDAAAIQTETSRALAAEAALRASISSSGSSSGSISVVNGQVFFTPSGS